MIRKMKLKNVFELKKYEFAKPIRFTENEKKLMRHVLDLFINYFHKKYPNIVLEFHNKFDLTLEQYQQFVPNPSFMSLVKFYPFGEMIFEFNENCLTQFESPWEALHSQLADLFLESFIKKFPEFPWEKIPVKYFQSPHKINTKRINYSGLQILLSTKSQGRSGFLSIFIPYFSVEPLFNLQQHKLIIKELEHELKIKRFMRKDENSYTLEDTKELFLVSGFAKIRQKEVNNLKHCQILPMDRLPDNRLCLLDPVNKTVLGEFELYVNNDKFVFHLSSLYKKEMHYFEYLKSLGFKQYALFEKSVKPALILFSKFDFKLLKKTKEKMNFESDIPLVPNYNQLILIDTIKPISWGFILGKGDKEFGFRIRKLP